MINQIRLFSKRSERVEAIASAPSSRGIPQFDSVFFCAGQSGTGASFCIGTHHGL
jgi:hypothetical protein